MLLKQLIIEQKKQGLMLGMFLGTLGAIASGICHLVQKKSESVKKYLKQGRIFNVASSYNENE